jgi:hypothetical protein
MDDETKQIISTALASFIRHGLTTAAGIIATLGWIQSSQTQSFVDIGSGIALGAIAYGWSLYQKKGLAGMVQALHFTNNNAQTPPEVKQVVSAAIAGTK